MLKFFRKRFKKNKHKHNIPQPPQRISSLYKAIAGLQNRRNAPAVPERTSSLKLEYKPGFVSFIQTGSFEPPVPERTSSLNRNKNMPEYKTGFINFLNN